MRIVDGNKISELILEGCKVLLNKEYVTPKLSIVMAGNNNSSLTYIEKKRQAGEKVGVDVEIHKLDNTNTQELVSLIGKLNEDSSVTGIILQLPLPKDINEYKICSAIDPSKDVDGLNPVSMGDIWLNKKTKI